MRKERGMGEEGEREKDGKSEVKEREDGGGLRGRR